MKVGDTVWIVERDAWWCNIVKRNVADDKLHSALVVAICDNGDPILHYTYFLHGHRVVITRVKADTTYATEELAREALRPS